MTARWLVLVVLLAAAEARADAGADAGADADTSDAAAEAPAPTDAVAEPRPPAAPATRGTVLRGRVLAQGTRAPLAGAAITVDAVPAGETDAGGRFELELPAGPHHVAVQYPGHELVARRIDVVEHAAEETFRLPPSLTGERYETTVEAAATGAPRVTLSGDEARKTAGTSGDPLRVLASLPGVSQVVWPAAVFVVRGANPGNTGFFIDGMRVPATFHLALGPSLLHPYLVAGVDFFPGGYPAGLGGAVGGAVSIRTAAPPPDRVRASADVTLYDSSAIVTGPFDQQRGAVAAAARYSYTAPLLRLLDAGTAFTYGDYQLRADHPAGGGQVTLFAFGSLDRIGSTQVEVAKQDAALQFHRLDVRWRGPLAGGRLLAAVNGGLDRAQSSLFARPIKMRAWSAAPRIVYDHPLGAGLSLQVGADALAQRFTAEVPMFQPRQSDLGRTRSAFSQGTFATLVIRAPRLVITPGLRGDLFAEQGTRRFALEPRLDARITLSEATALTLTAGRFAQMPSLPINISGFESFGLADLGLQTSLGGSLGVEVKLPGAVTASLTGFGQRLRVTDVRNIDLVTPDPQAPDFLVSRRGLAAGAELLVRRADMGRAFGWLAYTLSWSLREDDNGVLGRSDWDQRHILNLVGGYRLRRGYSVGARFHYNTGRYAPVYDSGGQYQQLPAFYQLDLRADRRFVFDRFVLDAFVDVANATITREVIQLQTVVDPSTGMSRVVAGDVFLVLPTVGLHAEF